MSFDNDLVRLQAALATRVDELRRKFGAEAFLNLVDEYFLRRPKPSVSPDTTALFEKHFPHDASPRNLLPSRQDDAFDHLLWQFDDGDFFGPEPEIDRPRIDEIAMVLCAIHDADKTLPHKITDIPDDELLRKWPRFFVIREEAASRAIPTAAFERLNSWAAELEHFLEDNPPPESVANTVDARVRRTKSESSNQQNRVRSRRGVKGRRPDERFAEIERLHQHVIGEKLMKDSDLKAAKKRARNWLTTRWNKPLKDGSLWRDALSDENKIKLCKIQCELVPKLWPSWNKTTRSTLHNKNSFVLRKKSTPYFSTRNRPS